MRLLRLRSSVPWKRALGELALIVGGVLIALALDSWWQGREERDRETAYLHQLLADLQETQSRLEESVTGDDRMLEWVSGVLERAYNGSPPPSDSLDLPTGYNQFRPLTGTQVALVQSGDLQLVESDSVRFRVIAYTALIEATEALLRHTETLIWNSTERVIRARALHSRGSGSRWGAIDAAAALGDPELISALEVQAAASRNRVRNLRRLEEPTAELIRLVEAELAER